MVYIIGAGMDGTRDLTGETKELINGARILIGSERVLAGYGDKDTIILKGAGEIAEEACRYPDNETVCVLLSGDAMFFSTGADLYRMLRERRRNVRIIPGISSVAYFCAAIGRSWSDAKLVSAHGRNISLIAHIRDNRKIFALLGSLSQARDLLEKLYYYGMSSVTLYVGVRLGYEDERILEFKGGEKYEAPKGDESLAVIFAVNEAAQPYLRLCPSDDEFIRRSFSQGVIPMTKKFVRTMAIEALELKKDSIFIDVGAGSGTVSVAAALLDADMRVLAVEKETEACILISENKRKFLADNVEIVNGRAPEVFGELFYSGVSKKPEWEMPTHAFIGGGGTDAGKIIDALFELNPRIRIVITIVSLTTLKFLTDYLEFHGEVESDMVHIILSREKRAGTHRLMTAENGVYIATLRRKEGSGWE